jgi:hypothetical protein
MGLTLNQETSNRVREVVLPPLVGRNEACHCGSGVKYKRCCRERDEALRRQLRRAAVPAWIDDSRGKLQQFEKYVCNVFGLADLLASFVDTRRAPKIPTFDVANSLFHTAVLRIPSINALEGDLRESDFQKLIGRQPTPDVKAFSADVVANVLDKLQLQGIRKAIHEVINKAERNKAFRDGCYSALRCVAIDGWEPFSSYDRHCPNCLVRRVKVKRRTGELEEVEQYYHHYVVALLLGPVLDVVLGIEPVLNEEALRDIDPEHEGHEGELTAARRLIDSLHDTYGGFIDAFVLDALYANGPVMTQLTNYGYSGFLVLKKQKDEPFKEALTLWQMHGPCEKYEDPDRKEQVEFWDVDEIETLNSYKGKVRAVRALVTKPDQDPTTWSFAIIGQRARQLGRRTALQIMRSRWHIENTAFNQWVRYWNLGHVFRHTQNALSAVLLLWTLAFNLLQMFVYRRLGRCRRPKDSTDTIRHIVEVMLRDMATLPKPIPWAAFLLDTS